MYMIITINSVYFLIFALEVGTTWG